MLIHSAIKLIEPDILAKPYTDKYASMVQAAEWHQPGLDTPIIVPISCDTTTTECNQDQYYQDLIPDSNKKSVMYFTVLRALRDTGPAIQMSERLFRKMEGSVRLLGWLNLKKLGIDRDCNFAAKVVRDLMPIFTKRFEPVDLAGTEFEKGRVVFSLIAEPIKDIGLFGQYVYPSINSYTMYPYDYFAIDIRIKIDLNLGCPYDVTLGTEINCIDNTAP